MYCGCVEDEMLPARVGRTTALVKEIKTPTWTCDISLFCQNNLLYTHESLSRYRPGEYHPVTLGDTFKNGRYRVYHKLGWGGVSTVWLADDRDRNRWFSLRIITADLRDPRELENSKVLDNFSHEGPNGVHQCLVFELLDPSVDRVLADYCEGHDKLCPETVLRMSTAGMCHGDISGRNMAFSCTHLSHASENETFEVLGTPEIEPLVRVDGAPLQNGLPTQLVKAAEWVEWVDEDDEEFRLLDVGESFLQGEEPKVLAQPGTLRVPETIFTDSFNYRVDLWRAGCMIHSFVFTTYPFWYLGEDEGLVFQMIGPGTKIRREVRDPKLAPLLPVIQGLMRFLPSARITADKALNVLSRTGTQLEQ
ncbi:kinase-like domain-containing protein [Aspergillus transmontanensis]|uniref:non-specific serine/threonine protein kinase n=1 Tax=Aspergillus transmontanensis TaxID=1034304 RepID=A0A5N6VW87_9EURO|nr:kinase-like domain-containing protein [Aspergillus transmontanensis]